MNTTVHLSFRYSESDYVRAARAHYASPLRLRVDAVLALVLASLGVWLWQSPSLSWLGVTFVVVSSLFILVLVAHFTVIPRLAFRRELTFREDYSFTFSPEGIHFRSTNIDSRLQWSLYSRALVDAHSYVLYYGSHQFTVIPKRVFQNAEQQETFEGLLTRHVTRIVRRERIRPR